MPLDQDLRDSIHGYCTKDLQGSLEWHIAQFAFIDDEELRKRLGRAFYSARYVYKLMEALFASGDEIHPFVKFQIMQYASIYEAVIAYLFRTRYKDHPEVASMRMHKAYTPVAALSTLTKLQYDGQELFTCVYKDKRTRLNDIPFGAKVDCAVRIGLLDEKYAAEIKHIYELRNLAHIETEAEKQIEVQLEQAKTGFWRMKPFLERLTEVLGNP